MNFPFQLTDGSQISALMFESDDGFSTILTRQCSGSMTGAGGGTAGWTGAACARPACGAAAAPPARPPRPGCTQGPAATISTLVIVPWRIEKERSDSHVAAAAF